MKRPTEMSRSLSLLAIGGWLSIGIAALHIVVIFIGVPGYRYFGAGEDIVRLAEQGSALRVMITVLVATAFVVFSLYALSGAGRIRRLPLLRAGP